MADWTDDYTRSRAIGVVPYAVEDLIGRQTGVDRVATTAMTVSGTADRLPVSPLPRRNYIKVTNVGAVDVAIIPDPSTSVSGGFIISASGGTWEDNTDAILYIVSTGADSDVVVYERSSRATVNDTM